MTLAELYANALIRHRKLRDGRFTIGMMRGWLNRQVTAGLLERRGGRYYLTAEGYDVASQLDLTIA